MLQRVGHKLRARLRGARSALAGRLREARTAVAGGPNDWRLAYLSFGVFALGVLTIVLFPFCLIISYVLSRSGTAVAREQGLELGAGRKWLLYPPLVIVSTALLIGFMFGPPIAATAAIAEGIDDLDRRGRRVVVNERDEWRAEAISASQRALSSFPGGRETRAVLATLFVGAGFCSAWWLIVGILGIIFPATVRAAFPPLCDRFRRSRGLKLAGISLLLLFVWVVIAFEIAANAGLIR
jgi:hypothetical protein